jgi:hypothetical protein
VAGPWFEAAREKRYICEPGEERILNELKPIPETPVKA